MTKSKKSSTLMNYAGTAGALLILCIILSIASPNFLKFSNFMSILKQTPFTAMLASGMLFCLITAGIDLSVGANATFCACLAGMLIQKGITTNSFVLIVVALIAGTLIGFINGTLLTRLHLPHPFVSTLGMKTYSGAHPWLLLVRRWFLSLAVTALWRWAQRIWAAFRSAS